MASLHNVSRKLPILIVDDNVNNRKIVKKALVSLGFQNMTEAEDGETALEKLKEESFRLIISDWDMPKLSGIDLLRQVRESEEWGSTPFIIMAGEATKERVTEAAQAGVSNYMVKPFTIEDLRGKLEAISGRL